MCWNTDYYLLSHLAFVAAQPKGKIVVEGLISFIAWKMGAKVAAEENGIEGNYAIDLDFCKHIHMVRDIVGKRTNFQLLIFKVDSILLQDPLRIEKFRHFQTKFRQRGILKYLIFCSKRDNFIYLLVVIYFSLIYFFYFYFTFFFLYFILFSFFLLFIFIYLFCLCFIKF